MSGLDGNQIYQAFYSGLLRVRAAQERLNHINVYPVADGDTGTNITATLSHALESAEVSESAGETLVSVADGALMGARGNSGIIFAQFFNGLSESLAHAREIEMEAFVRGVENARSRAYEAISNPQEGTILSVIHAWAEALRREVASAPSITELFSRTMPPVRHALERTSEQLAVLKAAGVVDAGASGFVEFIAGVERFIKRGMPAGARLGARKKKAREEISDVHGGERPVFRYCTEAMVVGETIDREALRGALEPLGDSLIVAGNDERARVHIHTDEPAQAFASIGAHGQVIQPKVDDMRLQYEVVHERKYPIALVTDSVCDLPQELIDLYQIHVVPLHILFGKSEYLDKLTIDPELFFSLAKHAEIFPTSSQPAVGLFTRLYSFLSSHYESVIAVHIAGKLSGTYSTSARAAESLEDGKKITVVDSRHIAGSEGLIVLRVAEAIAAGRSHDEIVAEIDGWSKKAELLVGVHTLEFLIRGGRVTPLEGMLARALNLKPIISVDEEGKSILYGKALSIRQNIAKIVKMTVRIHAETPLRAYGVLHGHDLAAANEFAARLERELGFPPLFIEEISPAAALHAGQGALAVSLMRE
ncbi:MAG: DegV family protein [Gaiellaceae bacterium]